MNEGYIKLLVKVLDIGKNKVRWKHLCYIKKDLYDRYMKDQGLTNNDLNQLLARWCKEDYCIDIPMSSSNDIMMLKQVVQDFFRRSYPDLFREGKGFDRQGWLRIWVTRKMKEDLGIYGDESF